MKFYKNTDSVDIAAKSIGVHCGENLDNRGLCIQIRHNGNKELFEKACKMAEVIVKALNEELISDDEIANEYNVGE